MCMAVHHFYQHGTQGQPHGFASCSCSPHRGLHDQSVNEIEVVDQQVHHRPSMKLLVQVVVTKIDLLSDLMILPLELSFLVHDVIPILADVEECCWTGRQSLWLSSSPPNETLVLTHNDVQLQVLDLSKELSSQVLHLLMLFLKLSESCL